MRIVVAVTNDIVTDQRVARTCDALVEDGHSVMLIGRLLPDSKPLSRPYRVCRMRLLFRRSALFYAEYNIRLFLRLLTAKADLFYANDTDTLLAAYCAARIRRKKVFFDAHEMFPEVPELVARPRVKRVWEAIERRIVPHVDGAVTVCQSIADIYREKYGVEMGVVRNVPAKRSVVKGEAAVPPMILYQGAVNVGRGIDRIIDAMEFLPEMRFVVAGVGDEYEKMRTYAASKPWGERIEFLGRLAPEELHRLTPTATIGACLLDNMGLNYYYSLPNRIGDFVAAGVPLLATDFPEIRRVIATYGVGELVGEERGEALADAIRNAVAKWSMLSNDERLRRMETASRDLSWENDKKILLGAVEAAANHKK